MVGNHIITEIKKVNHSPFTVEENLAVGKAEAKKAILHASLFSGHIHVCRLKAMAGGDNFVLDHLLTMADAWGVRVDLD